MNEGDKLWEECKQAGAVLKGFPKGNLGLTPDTVKTTPEWRNAKQAYKKAFAKLRAFNANRKT